MENELLDSDGLRIIKREKPYLLLIASIFVVAGFIISDLVAFWNVRTIIYSGPIMELAGVFALVVSLVIKNKLGIILGVVSTLIVLIIFLAIFLLDISPGEAQGLVPFFAAVCWIPILVLGILLWVEMNKRWK